MAGTQSNNVKMFGKVALDCGWLQTSSTKSNMPIRPQEIGRRSGNLRPFQLRIILCVSWNRVNMQQLAPARYPGGTIRLAEQKQVEARVVQLLEQILHRTIRLQLEAEPGKAIAGNRCAVRQSGKSQRQRTIRVADADL